MDNSQKYIKKRKIKHMYVCNGFNHYKQKNNTNAIKMKRTYANLVKSGISRKKICALFIVFHIKQQKQKKKE